MTPYFIIFNNPILINKREINIYHNLIVIESQYFQIPLTICDTLDLSWAKVCLLGGANRVHLVNIRVEKRSYDEILGF